MRLPWLQMRRLQVRLARLLGLWRLRRLLLVLGALPLVLDRLQWVDRHRLSRPVLRHPACLCPSAAAG